MTVEKLQMRCFVGSSVRDLVEIMMEKQNKLHEGCLRSCECELTIFPFECNLIWIQKNSFSIFVGGVRFLSLLLFYSLHRLSRYALRLKV